jgi:hypothetical protein
VLHAGRGRVVQFAVSGEHPVPTVHSTFQLWTALL